MRRGLLLALALVMAVAGCEGDPPAPPPAPTPAAPPEIRAVAPVPGAPEVELRPRFRWRLPREIAMPNYVSFVLDRVAGPEAAGEDEGERIATATGLHDADPTMLDLFRPPRGAIVTGPVRSMDALAPGTWYRWTVTALDPDSHAAGRFVFRTDPDAAPTEAAAGAGEDAVETVDVVLLGLGSDRVALVKAVREVTGLGLEESTERIERSPAVILQDVPRAEAELARRKLEAAGGLVDLR